MPEAFLYAGLYVGLIGIPIIGFICILCMQLMVSSVINFTAKWQVILLILENFLTKLIRRNVPNDFWNVLMKLMQYAAGYSVYKKMCLMVEGFAFDTKYSG